MANVRSANTYYIDTQGETLDIKNIKVLYIVINSTAANAQLVLQDVTTGNTKLNLRVDSAHKTEYFDFADNPIVFPNGINPSALSANCTATLVIQETRT
jgi:hypothetical protein